MYEIEKLNNDNNIHGILIQLPIPKHLNEEKILRKINYLMANISCLNYLIIIIYL